MDSRDLFVIDGVGYRVHVLKLTRKFSVLDSEKAGRTMDGQMYREPIGTFYNYSMTVAPLGNNRDLDKFWDVISKPQKSHQCRFPYGQKTLTQKMYVTAGEQRLRRAAPGKNHWDELTLEFTALAPEVKP